MKVLCRTSLFRPWPERLSNKLKPLTVQYRKHGTRISAEHFCSVAAMVDERASELEQQPDDRPYVLFSHSMDAMHVRSCLVTLQRQFPHPSHLFVSGLASPGHHQHGHIIHLLPNNQFIQELDGLGDRPRNVLENVELMTLLLPATGTSLEDTYNWSTCNHCKLAFPLTISGSKKDRSIPVMHLANLAACTYRTPMYIFSPVSIYPPQGLS